MRGTEFSLHLPHQVRKLAARCDPIQKWQIPLIDMFPIHAGHILRPEEIALKSPRLAIHLVPFGCWHNRGFNTIQVNPTGLPI